MKSKKILILGASSDIGLKTIDLYLNKGWKVFCHYNQNSKKLLTLRSGKYAITARLLRRTCRAWLL